MTLFRSLDAIAVRLLRGIFFAVTISAVTAVPIGVMIISSDGYTRPIRLPGPRCNS
jgi:hypothetical protein